MTLTNYPIIMGKPITREEIMQALREGYNATVALAQQEDPAIVGYPDMVTVLDWIEEHGLPPRNEHSATPISQPT